jgi:hypothetical protein
MSLFDSRLAANICLLHLTSTPFCFKHERQKMAEEMTNGEHAVDSVETKKVLLSNSTKQRTTELLSLLDRLEGR